MSRENVEVVRQMWQAFLHGDATESLSAYDENVEWDGTNLPDGRVSRGLEAIIDHTARWASVWEVWKVETERFVDVSDEQVLVLIRERGRTKAGLEADERHAELYTLRHGKIVRRQGFSDPAEAFEAAGVRE
jgi:ketosteroid isomerase-like protein